MDASLGSRVPHDTDGLARAFASAGVGLCTLPAHRQAAQVSNASITLDALQPLEVHADLAPQITFDDVFAVLDRMDDLRELLE